MFFASYFPTTYWNDSYFDKFGAATILTLVAGSLALLGVGK